MSGRDEGWTYEKAGVDRGRARDAIAGIARETESTRRPGVMGKLGGFAGAFDLGACNYRDPVLLAGADGVGTKLELAVEMRKHDTVGIDLVAMCVNDVLVHGAEPLFFLDYIAMSRLEPDVITALARGIAAGCRDAGCALLGGETAELPGMYPEGTYELAGFCVGAVERDRLLDGSGVRAGDAVVGLWSSGIHSNGYSLVRRVVADAPVGLSDFVPELGRTLGDELLTPTRIYVRPVLELLETCTVRALAHITGGGLPGNVPRVLPEGLGVRLERRSWPEPPIFGLLARWGNVNRDSMAATFNLGLGMIAVVSPGDAGDAIVKLERAGVPASIVGRVEAGEQKVILVD